MQTKAVTVVQVLQQMLKLQLPQRPLSAQGLGLEDSTMVPIFSARNALFACAMGATEACGALCHDERCIEYLNII